MKLGSEKRPHNEEDIRDNKNSAICRNDIKHLADNFMDFGYLMTDEEILALMSQRVPKDISWVLPYEDE